MRSALFLLFFCVTPLAIAQTTDCPLSSTIVVDGKVDDWTMSWIEDEDKEFSYNFCADDQYLYVRAKTSEFFTKRKLAIFGFTLWFDPNGKKKRTYGLKFPVGGAEAEERMAQANQLVPTANTTGERADFQKAADRMLIENLEVLELIGLSDDPLTATRSGITNGIKVAIDMDDMGAYTYEALIPFKSFRLSRQGMSGLYVGLETGKFTVPKQKPTTKNAPVAGPDLTPSQLSRMQGYGNLQGNPKLTYASDVWIKMPSKN